MKLNLLNKIDSFLFSQSLTRLESLHTYHFVLTNEEEDLKVRCKLFQILITQLWKIVQLG